MLLFKKEKRKKKKRGEEIFTLKNKHPNFMRNASFLPPTPPINLV
jgi:hypothetical protein